MNPTFLKIDPVLSLSTKMYLLCVKEKKYENSRKAKRKGFFFFKTFEF